MSDYPRLIEFAFPLKQTSIDAVHEKNVRHGHISTLHIWPARRPLAACRAALIATLLPDPSAEPKPAGMTDEQWQQEIQHRRAELCEKIGGTVVEKVERKKMPNGQVVERIKEETKGGILHWGRETENASTLEWFREQIRAANGGRAPKVLDPFAGGGAIPLEAMRLGCEVTAADINPVAWFILKCTLEYPQKLAGQTRRLPEFILSNTGFMTDFLKTKGLSRKEISRTLERLGHRQDDQGGFDFIAELGSNLFEADLAWHVRAWGQWVLDNARRDLGQNYPTYADFEPLKPGVLSFEPLPMQLVPLRDDGTTQIDALNAGLSAEYLRDPRNPRWVAKPTVAYLWARSVTCKNCRATVPLLKTMWLCKKAGKRVLLVAETTDNVGGITFRIQTAVPVSGANAAQIRENDKRLGTGTMSRAGAKCFACAAIMTMEDLRTDGIAGRLAEIATAVVVDGQDDKEYRIPTPLETRCANEASHQTDPIFSAVPFGMISEPTPDVDALGMRIAKYGFRRWDDLFTSRQLVSLGTYTAVTRKVARTLDDSSYPDEWSEAISAYLASMLDRLANQSSNLSRWNQGGENIEGTFARFALPILWDFAEVNPLGDTSGGYLSAINWVSLVCSHVSAAATRRPAPAARLQSAIVQEGVGYDCILTDPPYYDAIPYSDLMDFFYVWLRRTLTGLSPEYDAAFSQNLGPKWDHATRDGELIDDSSRHDRNAATSKAAYEDGMARAFHACWHALSASGRLVVVFAHKHPDAWETLVAAMIRAGFVVDASWPIQTERGARTRALRGAALSSSVWLVCKKRPVDARPGWDNNVLEEMKVNISARLRDFWDAGIRGPDFVWAATGPALEAYSKHPVVKKANESNATMSVTEFLTHVRRMVVDYVVGQVLAGEKAGAGEAAGADQLDEVSAYYLLHRHDFGMDDAPVGACILYATACGLSDSELDKTWDLVAHSGTGHGRTEDVDDDESDENSDGESGTGGSTVKLKLWNQRRGKSMGLEAPGGRAVPLIDRIHRLMHLWKDGDVFKVDEFLDDHALRRHELFKRVVQALVELSTGSEKALLESISNHIEGKGAIAEPDSHLPDVGGEFVGKE